MSERDEEIKEQYHKIQRLGMQDLRFMLMLLTIGLLLYTALGFYIVYTIQERNEFMQTYLLYGVGTFVVWCIPIRLLWNFNRLGRMLFLLCTIASMYMYRNAGTLFTLDIESQFYKYCFIAIFICKCIMIICCSYRLMAGKRIKCIWSVDTMFDEDLARLEEPLHELPSDAKKVTPRIEKAQKILRRASIRLGIVLYLSVILIMLLLTLLQVALPSISEGIAVIQNALFSECLFSIMLWSAPIIALFVAKTWSPYLLYVATLGEFIRIIISYQSYLDIFYNKSIPIEVNILFVMIECMRYILLLSTCRRIWHSRLIKQYCRIKQEKK